MREIEAGRRTFAPRVQNESGFAEFQIVARDLDWLYRRGYLRLFKPLRESQSGRRQFAVVQVGDLRSPSLCNQYERFRDQVKLAKYNAGEFMRYLDEQN